MHPRPERPDAPRRVFANRRRVPALDAARRTPIFPPMPKPVSAPPPEPSFWFPFVMAGIVGALLGSTITYLALRPQLDRAARVQLTPAPADNLNHAPPASLTAGLAPAQADRALGNFYYDHANWPLAQKHYESAIRQGQDDPDIRTDLGNVYRFTGRPNEALAQYELAQRMNPQHEFSLFNQGGLFLEEMKDPARAIAAWNEYLRRFPHGRNVGVARQLIAQASGGAALPSAGQSTTPSARPPDATDQRLLDLVNKPAPQKP
ncbi:MAG: hypothetical protein C0502_02620 [Opitutus sp.]|nr:hypothetical protein [Opitutus sp.]